MKSYEIPINFQRAMEHAENIDIAIRLDQISNSIMAVEQNSDGARRFSFVSITSFGVIFE